MVAILHFSCFSQIARGLRYTPTMIGFTIKLVFRSWQGARTYFYFRFSFIITITPWEFLSLFLLLESFSHQRYRMIFLWSLSDNMSPQVSSILLRILSNAIVCIVYIRPVISKSSCPFTNHLVTVPRAPITTGKTVTLMFYSFFNSLTRLWYSSFISLSFNFTLWFAGTAKSTIQEVLFFFVIISSSHLTTIRWSVCISEYQGSFCLLISRKNSGFCIYHLFRWSNLNF